MAYRRRSFGGLSREDSELLAAALFGYEQQRSEIETRIAELRRQLGGSWASVPTGSTDGARPAPKKRTMSAAGRKRIAAAQRKRWAEYRKGQAPAAKKKTVAVQKAAAPSAKRRMSATARKRIADAQKNRWAEARAKKAPKVKAAGA
jgi:hypothetical protein